MNMKTTVIKILILIASFGIFATTFAWTFTSGWANDKVIYCEPGSVNWKDCNIDNWVWIVSDWVNNIKKDTTFFQYVQDMLIYIMWFVALLWVLYIIYAWFGMMHDNWDGSKVKKSKSTITYVLLWIIVMFAAYPLIKWILVLVNSWT